MNSINLSASKLLTLKTFSICALMFISLIIPAFLTQHYPIFENAIYNHIIKVILVGTIVLIGIWLLRSKIDKGIPHKIGLNNPRIATRNFILGISFILVPLILTLFLSEIFGWVKFSINTNSTIILSLFIGFISTFFTDAISEELIFRGYIYSNLKEHFSELKSSIITLIIFVIAPLILITLQNSLNIEGAVALSGGYVINLLFFGAFMQYLRILFNSIWPGVGFHVVFVHMNQMMGIGTDNFLQFSEDSNQQPVQITLIIFLIVVFLSLILYPILKRRRIKIQSIQQTN